MERADFPKTSLKTSSSFGLETVRQFWARFFFAGEHVGKFDAIADQIPKLPDFRRRDKTGFDHIAHE